MTGHAQAGVWRNSGAVWTSIETRPLGWMLFYNTKKMASTSEKCLLVTTRYVQNSAALMAIQLSCANAEKHVCVNYLPLKKSCRQEGCDYT